MQPMKLPVAGHHRTSKLWNCQFLDFTMYPAYESASCLSPQGIWRNNWHTSFMTVSCLFCACTDFLLQVPLYNIHVTCLLKACCVMLGTITYSDIGETDVSVMSDIGAFDVNYSCIVSVILNWLWLPNCCKWHKVIKVIAIWVNTHIKIDLETDISAMCPLSLDHSCSCNRDRGEL